MSRSSIALVLVVSLACARAAPARAAEAAQPDREATTEQEHVRVGALGAAGFPRPLAVEGMVKLERTVGLGLEYSVMPTITVSGARATFHALAGDLRIFPFAGAFFVGARVGSQHLAAAGTYVVPRYGTFVESASIDTWFVNPRLGMLWTSGMGLTIGVDAGLQIPISYDESSTLPDAVAAATGVKSAMDIVGKSMLPTINVLEFGVLF